MSHSKKEGLREHGEAGKGASVAQIKKSDADEVESQVDKLRTRIDEILFYKWDPLHLSNSNWSRDEYIFYTDHVFRLALESTSYRPVADYLTMVATVRMCMDEDREHDDKIARLIFSLVSNEPHYPDHVVVEV